MKRARRVLKWSVTAVCCIVLMAWAASMFNYYGYVVRMGGYRYAIGTMPSQIGVGVDRGATLVPGFHFARVRGLELGSWRIDQIRLGTLATGATATMVYVPFWMPLLLFGVPAAWLWFIDRRADRNCCLKCGYPVGTNERCTECGAVVKPKAVQA